MRNVFVEMSVRLIFVFKILLLDIYVFNRVFNKTLFIKKKCIVLENMYIFFFYRKEEIFMGDRGFLRLIYLKK